MLHFVLGRIKSGKTSWIINKMKENRNKEMLFLVPEPYSHSMERLFCEKCGNEMTQNARVTNFRRLAAEVKSEVGGGAAEIVGGGRSILNLHAAVGAVSAGLGVLAKSAQRPERLPDILSAIDEFKAYGISPEKLSEVSINLSNHCKSKLSELALIYAAYENMLGEDSFDAYDELDFVAQKIKENKFFCGKTLFFDGFSGFTAAEFDMIASAIVQADDVYIALEVDKAEDIGAENGIFDKAYDTKKRIIAIAERVMVEYDEEILERKGEDAISHLDNAIFSNEIMKYEEAANEITFANADNVFEECELAAAYIIDNIREKGMRYRDFSVAVTSDTEYLRTCEMVFARYGIPVYISSARDLISKPAIAIILAAFDLIIRGFRSDAVMEYLKTGFSGICSKSLDIFENYIYTWNPKASAWKDGNAFLKNPLGLTAEETDESKELLRIVNCVREKIYRPIERLRQALKNGKTGEKCAEALYAFINEINIPRRCNAYAYLAERAGKLTDAREYERVMSILCDAIDNLGRAIGDDEISIDDFYVLFKIVISQYELDTIPASLDCVSVDELSHADGERCPVRIILGANDGKFPSGADSSGILSDSDRAELSDCGIELAPGMTERIFEQYRTVHNVICSGERGLYISCVLSDAKGEGCAEAPVVLRLRETYPHANKHMSVREARFRARIPCFDESIACGESEELWEGDEALREKLRRARENTNGRRGPIMDKENIEAIFGKKIRLSASRADLFSSCRYAYFLKYGLFAKPKERAEINAIEAGTLMHYVLENVFKRMAETQSTEVSLALEYAREACREYVEISLRGDDEFSGRNKFLIEKLQKTVEYAVADICRELKKSRFYPREFELKFTGYDEDLPAIEVSGENSTVALRGAVDRIDVYETEDKLYFRVVDYKSGKKKFSLDETVNGIGMQMLLYMFAIEEMGKERFGKSPEPAGVMYVPISREYSDLRGVASGTKRREGVVLRDMGIIEAMECGESKEYIPVSLDKSGGLKSNSVVLSKREFDLVKKRMKEILANIGDELSCGAIEPNPYVHQSYTSCDWCDYKSVCAFDEERSDDCKRELCEMKICDMLETAGGEEDEQC